MRRCGRLGLGAVILPAQQLRQLGDVGGDAPGFVRSEQLGRRAPSRLILEIDVGEATCPVASQTMKQASVSSTDHGGGKRRSGFSIIALSLTRDYKPRKAKSARSGRAALASRTGASGFVLAATQTLDERRDPGGAWLGVHCRGLPRVARVVQFSGGSLKPGAS
jgi:hypothetical protein